MNMYTTPTGAHKYPVGSTLWVWEGELGGFAFKAKVLRLSNKCYTYDVETGEPIIQNTYFIEGTGKTFYDPVAQRRTKKIIVEIPESWVLADYDNETEMAQFRGEEENMRETYKCECPSCSMKGNKPLITENHHEMVSHLWDSLVTTKLVRTKGDR